MFYKLNNIKNNYSNYGEISSFLLEERKSKFISYIFKIKNESEAKDYISKIKKENKDARHIVYIYSFLGSNNLPVINFSDDGEPQGTGTKAIYELITKEKITDICIIIVRYFGGILLGAGPLSRAYLNSARGAINKCIKEEVYNYIPIDITISYSKYDIILSKLNPYFLNKNILLINTKYEENIILNLQVADFIKEKLDIILKEL